MKQQGKSWRRRAESHAETALHAYPVLYCRSKSLRPEMPFTAILGAFQALLQGKLAAMPFWLRALVLYSWPPAVVAVALYQTARNGGFARRRHGRGILQQFIDQVGLAFADGVPPICYYIYELHEPRNALHAFEFIHRGYIKNNGLYKLFYRRLPDRKPHAKMLNNKLAFHLFCKECSLPSVEIFGSVDAGEFSWTDPDRQRLPEQNLFIKPRDGKGGRNAERWSYRDGTYSGPDGRRFSGGELTRHLAESSFDGPRLIQENLVNHPELSGLTAGALSTLRMYTLLDESGAPELTFSMLRMSQDSESVVDNVHRGGLADGVVTETGALLRATDDSTFARTGWLDRHPVTGEQIEGRVLPAWDETVNLVISAHRALPEAFVVGWDVAITAKGPRLVEGNKSPDIEIEQRLDGPWGNARFGQLLAFHLQAATDSQADRESA